MSRIRVIGEDIVTSKKVVVCYGYDYVVGCEPGYFFQVYTQDSEELKKDPSGEGIIVNEGLLDGLSKERLEELAVRYCVQIHYEIIHDCNIYRKMNQIKF